VLHPAPGDPGHAIWKRDLRACGLFTVLKDFSDSALCAMIDGLNSTASARPGRFESLIVPFDPRETRTATQWPHKGRASGSTRAWRTSRPDRGSRGGSSAALDLRVEPPLIKALA